MTLILNINKKVLLRERKRHTARRVVSTPSVVLPGYPPCGGLPGQVPPRGGTRSGTPRGGTRSGTPRGGTRSGTPRGGTRSGTPPPAAPWHSGKCCKALWDMGTPPVDRQTPVKTVPSRRTTYAGGKYIWTLLQLNGVYRVLSNDGLVQSSTLWLMSSFNEMYKCLVGNTKYYREKWRSIQFFVLITTISWFPL